MRIFVYSQAWIALLAALLAWFTTVTSGAKSIFLPIHGLIFLTTFSLYGWHKIFAYSKAGENQIKLERYYFVSRFPFFSKVIYTIAAIAALAWYFIGDFNFPLKLGLFGLGLAVFYVLPRVVSSRAGLRYSYIKPFVIASAWAIVTALLPAYQVETELDLSKVILLFGERFGHALMVAFCFDWRDRKIDLDSGLKSWSARSFENNIIACFLALALAFICRYNLPGNDFGLALLNIGILPGYFFAIVFAAVLKNDFSDFTYDFWYNGILGLPALGLIILTLG
ncbi:MAG: hypothetical protein AAF741_06390 [Bacteroidota bacterium]